MRYLPLSIVAVAAIVTLSSAVTAQTPPPLPEVTLPASGSAATIAAPANPEIPITAPAGEAPVPQNSNGALPVPPQQPAEPAPGEIPYSFGDSNVSVLFLPAQIEQMKQVLSIYEEQRRRNGPLGDSGPITTTETQAPQVVEPPSYPVFYLSSVVYKSPADWTVWISGHKITPQKNETDVQITSVTPTQVTFAWYPSYNAAIIARKQQGLIASPEPIKNRLIPPSFTHDELSGAFSFTLKPNQSFVVAYLSMFEGYIDSPVLPPLPLANADPNAPAGTAPPAGQPAPTTAPKDPATAAVESLQNRRPAQIPLGKAKP